MLAVRAGAGHPVVRMSLPGWRIFTIATLSAAVALGVALTGCAGGSGNDRAVEDDPVHVHGLGIDPADSSLYIATHTGLFRMEYGSDDSQRVGDGRQDTMGFTVVEGGRFLGSGHPELGAGLPPLLGLIESTDRGRSWRSVSLLGRADFHALRAQGPRVVGYDASGDRLMMSGDGGRTWTWSRPPQPLLDVAMHPRDARHLVAAAEAGLMASRDGGATWSAPAREAVALAWPEGDLLYAVAGDGATHLSGDGGQTWSVQGRLPGQPAALTTTGVGGLVAALHEGGFVHSSDGGRTWAAGAW